MFVSSCAVSELLDTHARILLQDYEQTMCRSEDIRQVEQDVGRGRESFVHVANKIAPLSSGFRTAREESGNQSWFAVVADES